ncbi:hypothetical protein CTI12_AA243690 [Artemisia annua]|uniref:KIB1-4 beta-propeller domain-containing protein n=1 Tax=Artemisia annua TaxID=35608 RepID=A0A2U1NP77_ARTAN|nr:hypothetical protein CTI12_AA243690 [Artemisia annua]
MGLNNHFSISWRKGTPLINIVMIPEATKKESVEYPSSIPLYVKIVSASGLNHVTDVLALSSLLIALKVESVNTFSLGLVAAHVSALRYRVDSKRKDDEIVVRSSTDYEAEFDELWLLSLPYDNLEMIMGLCVGVEYMNFRATCKHCHLAAPSIKWRDESALMRMQTYSLISPWLMVVHEDQDMITFTDPLLGDTYFMKNLHVSPTNKNIYCSRFGWLLFRSNHFHCLVFFNPFTGDLRKLPIADKFIMSACFSAPPTSPDCMVIGFSSEDVYIHFVAQEQSWRKLGVGPYSIRFPTFIGRDLYALHDEGELISFKNLGEDAYSETLVEAKAPRSCCKSLDDYYLMTRDQHLLLVIVSKFGERVEVFKQIDSKQEWEKIDSLGNYMIYICEQTCLCLEAKTPEMENKIYFPLLHFKNRKIVFYSLETCMYHTFNGENIQPDLKDFFGTTYQLFPHGWIEPSWY